jgi:hypothetical protein
MLAVASDDREEEDNMALNYGLAVGPGVRPKADGDGTSDYTTPPNYDSPYYGTPMPNDGGTSGGNGGGFNLGNAFSTIGQNAMNTITNGLSNPDLIPAMGAAWNSYNNAGRYQSEAERYASQLDPFGQQRGQYQDRLAQSYKDPTSILNDPGHKAEQSMQMDNIMRKLGAGGGSSSNMGVALGDYVTNSDAQYLSQERASLGNLAGAQFGPGAAAHMLETGLTSSMNARNQAMNALMYPFGNKNGGGTTINNNNGSNGKPQGPGSGPPGDPNFANQAANMLKNPNSLPEAMRSWSPSQLASWLQYNNPLGNDSQGNWLTTGGNGVGATGGQQGDMGMDGGGDQWTWRGDPNYDPENSQGWMDNGTFDQNGGGGSPYAGATNLSNTDFGGDQSWNWQADPGFSDGVNTDISDFNFDDVSSNFDSGGIFDWGW